MNPQEISAILKSVTATLGCPDARVNKLLTDSRSLTSAGDSLFFAITSKRNSGARYVKDLYDKGVRNFVVGSDTPAEYTSLFEELTDCNIWYVKNVIDALQQLAAYHRSLYHIPVVGITGSNGKTIVKDWVVQLLQSDHNLVFSPKSYNSQIGVPLSVWQMNSSHDMAVFEAGISQTGEMDRLRNVMQPTIGIFTNIGQAHDENFLTHDQKIAEKLHLFTHCDILIYCTDHKELNSVIAEKESALGLHTYTWGSSTEDDVMLQEVTVGTRSTVLSVKHDAEVTAIEIPFVDRASIENAMQCITLMYYLGYPGSEIQRRCRQLTPVAMRLELIEGINNCLLVNDSYSLDINSLMIALDFVQHEHQHQKKTLIMSDFQQSGMVEQELYEQVAALMQQRGITRFIGIGPALCRCRQRFAAIAQTTFYPNTEDFLKQQDMADFHNETILLKGARLYRFEFIAKLLQFKSHETMMEVNLGTMTRNLNYYRSLLSPGTKLMAMVKASSYGTGKVEVANALQFNHVDYLTVAYSDEGVALRQNGITLPIMVMNPEEDSFDSIIRHRLEPDIYSFRVLRLFNDTARLFCQEHERIAIHIEFDTGMHRLGFCGDDIASLADLLCDESCVLSVKSVFTHLACADDPAADDFTRKQISLFRQWSAALKAALHDETIMSHILNSSGIARFPEAQLDMVRLGIGLYGIAPEPAVQSHLQLVCHIRTRISQIKAIPQGEPVGYNGRWVAPRDSRIAIVPIGYADGLQRRLGYGRGTMVVNGKEAPIVGSICMDMCFLDVTDIGCDEGDEVVIYKDSEHLTRMAKAADTIPYELMTSISPRVKRVYIQE